MSEQVFQAVIEKIQGKCWISMPFDPDTAWGPKERHHVCGTVNGLAWRGVLSDDGGFYRLAIGPAWLRDSGLGEGSAVEVRLAPEGPQSGSLAEDVSAALAADPAASAFFDSLPTFYRKNYIRWIEEAKQARTRSARIQEMLGLLAAGERQRK